MAFYLDYNPATAALPRMRRSMLGGLGVYARVHAAVSAATRSDVHSVMLAQMLHSLRRFGLFVRFRALVSTSITSEAFACSFRLGLSTNRTLAQTQLSILQLGLSFIPRAAVCSYSLV